MNTKLLNVYGARFSKDGERINVSLCCGEGDSREWFSISLPLSKTRIDMDANTVDIINIKLLDTKA